MCFGVAPLSSSTAIPRHQVSTMPLEVRFEFRPKAKHGKSEIQHHQTCVRPTNVNLKLTTLHIMIPLPHCKKITSLLVLLSNSHIDLRCKTHYLHHCLSVSSFQPLLSTPSSWDYETLDGSDTYLWLVYLGEWTIKYSSQDPPSQNKVTFPLCQLCNVKLWVHYYTEGGVQISNNKYYC